MKLSLRLVWILSVSAATALPAVAQARSAKHRAHHKASHAKAAPKEAAPAAPRSATEQEFQNVFGVTAKGTATTSPPPAG